MRSIAAFALALAACSAPTTAVVLKVDGMQRGAGGKAWMAWPDAVKAALEGLAGVTRVEMDVERDLFRVSTDRAVRTDAIFEVVRTLGYTPRAADAADFRNASDMPAGDPPVALSRLIEQGRTGPRKFVLIRATGDHWVACERMSVETFADPGVKVVLESFALIEVNVDRDREAAAWLGVKGVPDVFILDRDARTRDRITGFMGPREFAARLRKLIEGR